MYVFIFVSTFMINFALYQAGPQNYANQGFEEKGPPFSQINYSGSTNGNKNRHTRQSDYTRYFDGEKEVVNIGNGINRKNVFYIGESPSVNSESSSNTNTNIGRRPNNFNQLPTNYYPHPQENPDLGNRFGSNEPSREITRINNVGNGIGNSNTFFINDLDGDKISVKVFSSSNNNNQRPNIQHSNYHPSTNNGNTNIQRNFNEGRTLRNNRFDSGPNGQPIQPDLRPRSNNNVNTNLPRNNEGSTVTYTTIGKGPDNTNVIFINGKPLRPGFGPNINYNANSNVQRHFDEGSTDTYNVFGQGRNNKNLVITNGNPVQGFSPNVDSNGRNFDEGNHAVPTNTYAYNKIGNGIANNNAFVINDKPIRTDSKTNVIYNDNINNRRLNQGVNFNNKGTTDIQSFTRIGHGPNNRNVVVINGETLYRSDSGLSVTTIERNEQGDSTLCRGTCPKYFMDSGEQKLHYLFDFSTTLIFFFGYLFKLV